MRSHVRQSAVPLSLISVALVLLVASASAAVPLTKISSYPYTNPSSQHKTQVEPDTFAFGIDDRRRASRSGRFFDGGASNIGWATSTDGGPSWTARFPARASRGSRATARTTASSDPVGRLRRAKHDVWMISSLALNGSPR